MKTNFIADEHTDFTEEKTRIRQMYQRITAPEDAMQRLIDLPEDAIQRLVDLPKDAQLIDFPEKAGRSQKHRFHPAWKIAAACLAAAILIPSSVFAAEKISTYIRQATHGQQENIQDHVVSSGSHAELQLEPTDVPPSDAQKKYVRVKTDFGADYVKEPVENLDENLDENTDDTYMLSYCHRDGFGAGKDFWYRLIQIDTDDTSALSLYDVKEPRNQVSSRLRHGVFPAHVPVFRRIRLYRRAGRHAGAGAKGHDGAGGKDFPEGDEQEEGTAIYPSQPLQQVPDRRQLPAGSRDR